MYTEGLGLGGQVPRVFRGPISDLGISGFAQNRVLKKWFQESMGRFREGFQDIFLKC